MHVCACSHACVWGGVGAYVLVLFRVCVYVAGMGVLFVLVLVDCVCVLELELYTLNWRPTTRWVAHEQNDWSHLLKQAHTNCRVIVILIISTAHRLTWVRKSLPGVLPGPSDVAGFLLSRE